jgi:hypothetical protein
VRTIPFVPVTIGDGEAIRRVFGGSVFRNCDYSFSNIFSWGGFYDTTFAEGEDGFFYVRSPAEGEVPGYLFPLGGSDLRAALERLEEDASERGDEFRLYAVTREMFERIEGVMPGRFVYETRRDWYEYIYLSEDLIRLGGKKYQAKRNHINKFKRTYRWEYVPITREIIPECLSLYDRWRAENAGGKSERSLIEERIATQKAFADYERLGLIGGALRIEGMIGAYSYGQPLTEDTFGVHAEKSLYEIEGGFAMMNQQFAERNCGGYRYVNREVDLGLDSLRQAKMSYHPAILLEKGYERLRGRRRMDMYPVHIRACLVCWGNILFHAGLSAGIGTNHVADCWNHGRRAMMMIGSMRKKPILKRTSNRPRILFKS